MANNGRHNNGRHNDIIDEEEFVITHEDDGADIGADDWASPDPSDRADDMPVFDRGRSSTSLDSMFDDPDKYTWG